MAGEPLDMDAPPTAPSMAGGWDINSSRPPCTPQFTSTFDMKPSIMDASRSHLNAGLASSPALTPSLGDYLANHSHRLLVGSNFGQPPMIGLRTTDPSYYMKEFAPRSEEFASLFDQSRPTRRGDDDLAGADSPPDMSLSTPAIPDSRLHDDEDASIACLPQFASRLLPMLSVDKSAMVANNMDVKVEDEKGNADDEEEEEDEDDDEDGGEDNDNDGSAQHCQTPTSGSVSAPMHAKAITVLWQGVSTGGSSPIACQDCGNQAKKDCEHMRCRTCCKSRGLNCMTHVKSTWVPAYKRRQRQQLLSNDNEQPIKLLHSRTARARPNLEQSAASDVAPAANSHTSTSTGTPPSSDLNWLQQDEREREFTRYSTLAEGRLKRMLPAEARENAVFKCVKVTGVHDGHEEFAYQTVVKIGGHIYKGMLFDQGVDKGQVPSSSIAELRLGGRSAAPSSSATIDLAGNLYGTSESVFLGGNNATR